MAPLVSVGVEEVTVVVTHPPVKLALGFDFKDRSTDVLVHGRRYTFQG